MAAILLQSVTRQILRITLPTAISKKTSPKHTFVGHRGNVWSFVFLQDNVHIVSGSEDGTMCKWDCETGLLVGKPWAVNDTVYALALSPDGMTIGCGRGDGSVQRWDTNGQKMEGIWTGHSDSVQSLSWSPSGHHLASGSSDGTILIRKAENGEVKIGPIKMNQGMAVFKNQGSISMSQRHMVITVAYSPLDDRIASGGDNLCIWDGNTGNLIVGPIHGYMYSIVWSPDGSKLYSTGWNTRVFDSTEGTELHRFQLDSHLISISLSLKHNLLAGVGYDFIQLWDTESYRPLGHPSYTKYTLCYVSFSPDGRYLAYGGEDQQVTLRTVKDSALVPLPAFSNDLQSGTPQAALPESRSSSDFNVDTSNSLAQSAVNTNDGRDDPYNTFFASPHSSLPSPSSNPSPMRHLTHALHLRADESIRLRQRLTRRLFSRRALSNSPLAHSDQTEPTRAINHHEERNGVDCPETVGPGEPDRGNGKGKQREEPIAHMQTCDLSSPDKLDSGGNRALWKSLLRDRKKDSRKALVAKVTQDRSPTVVEVYAVRGFKRIVVHKRNHKTKSVASAAPADAGGSSQAGPLLHGGAVHAQTSLEGPPSQSVPGTVVSSAGECWPTGTNCTDNDSCSDLSIQGPWLKFLEKICYPCGYYNEEDT